MIRVRGKRIVWIPMVLMIVLGVMAGVRPAFAQPVGDIYLVTAETFPWYKPPKNPGDTFTVQVFVNNLVDCYLIVFSLNWDDTVILLDSVTQGNCLEPSTSFLIADLPVSAGGTGANDYLGGVTYTRLGAVAGKNFPPPGLVATLQFHMVTSVPAITNIVFVDTIAYPTRWTSSPLGVPPSTEYLFLNLTGLTFELKYPAPHPPIAQFTWTPTMPYDGQTVSFTAGSAGCEGFDGDDVTPITTWEWDWDNDLVYDESWGVPTATHTFSPDGSYPVNLRVTAPGIGPYIDPAYVPTATKQNTLTVLAKIVGRNIDLTTEDTRSAYRTSSLWMKMVTTPFIGTGPNTWADAYGPQENVTLFANVTYNDCPVANKPVDFEIQRTWPSLGEWIIFRQARTDANGIATITFRLPWPDVNAETRVFGVWRAYASCDIADAKVEDRVYFEVGWILSSLTGPDISIPLPGAYRRGIDVMIVTTTIQNLGMISRAAVITVTLYDELGFVIGYQTISASVPPGVTVNFAMSIPIPKYAVCGVGIVFLNIFGALPTACGASYGPETSANFGVKC